MNTIRDGQVDPLGSKEQSERLADRNLIDFESILPVLVRRWILLVVVFLLVFGTSLLLAVVQPSKYRVSCLLFPPLPSNYELIGSEEGNIMFAPQDLSLNFYKIFDKGIFQEMYNNLNSISLRRNIYTQEVNKPATGIKESRTVDRIPDFDSFDKNLVVRLVEKNISGQSLLKPEALEVSYEGPYDPATMAQWVNSFVKLCQKTTINSFHARVREQIDFEKEIVQNKIRAIRDKAALLKQDRLILLAEALKIAEEQGIHEEIVLSSYSDAPLYLRGTKSLTAEIANLKQRKDNDLFAEDLRLYQQQLSELNQLQVRPDQFEAVRVDSYASPVGDEAGPGRLFFIGFGFIGGLIIAFTVVLLVYFLENIILYIRRAGK
jgi:chain length determinant protein (polysaccharide antigen chain regulator)